jgi:hypothetical protein
MRSFSQISEFIFKHNFQRGETVNNSLNIFINFAEVFNLAIRNNSNMIIFQTPNHKIKLLNYYHEMTFIFFIKRGLIKGYLCIL